MGVLGHMAKRVDPDFFDSILRIFIDKNRPEEGSGDQRMSEDIIIELIQQFYNMVNYINSSTYAQSHAKFLGKYGYSEYIFALPYDQALQEFKQIHGRTGQSESKFTQHSTLTC